MFEAARACLAADDPDTKLALTAATAAAWSPRLASPGATVPPHDGAVHPIERPGRPARPMLVHPREVPQRRLSTPEGRAALLHAVAHIEFNAINLAWDAVQRFGGLPVAYYADWVSVAADEARHFALVRARLRALGHDYGDFPAHDGLWEMARRTAGDLVARMALVPRLLEARGLDVTPGMIARLRGAGDPESVAVLEVILAEEVGHVAAGSRWFEHACRLAGLEPAPEFRRLLAEHAPGALRGPYNIPARLAAGFDPAELEGLGIATGD